MNNELTMDTVVKLKFKGSVERVTLSEFYNPDTHGDEEDFFAIIQAWIQTGRATIVKTQKTKYEEMADAVARELTSVEHGKTLEQDNVQRLNYNQGSHGYHAKVAFPAKTLLDAQEMQQTLIKNFNIDENQIGIEAKAGSVLVTITNCPVKAFSSIERAFGFKRATEAVSGMVEKTASTALNVTDMTLNNVAVPVAKTAIGTSTKVAKSLFGFSAKLAGIAVGEVTKATKQCVNEIKNDGYIAQAKGEVVDGIHAVKRKFGGSGFGGGGGIILE